MLPTYVSRSRTIIKKYQFEHYWEILDVTSVRGRTVSSPFADENGNTWQLALDREWSFEKRCYMCSLRLFYLTQNRYVNASVTFGLRQQKREEYHFLNDCSSQSYRLHSADKFCIPHKFFIEWLTLCDPRNGFLAFNNSVQISCYVNYTIDQHSHFSIPKEKSVNKGLAMDLFNAFRNGEGTDYTLLVENKTIHVHKFILRCRSPVFAAMLKNNWIEATDKCELHDYTYDVVLKAIEFLYTDRIGNVGNDYLEIARFAEQYLIESLKLWINHFLRTSKVSFTADDG